MMFKEMGGKSGVVQEIGVEIEGEIVVGDGWEVDLMLSSKRVERGQIVGEGGVFVWCESS